MTQLPLNPQELERVHRIKRKLRKNDPLHPITDALLQGMPLPAGYGQTIVEALESTSVRWRGRALAIWAAGIAPLSPEDSHRANLQLTQILRRRSGTAAGGAGCCVASCGAIIPYLIFVMPFLVWRDRIVNRLREMCAISMGRNRLAWNFYPLCETIAASSNSSSGAAAVRAAAVDSLAEIMRHAGPPPAGALNGTVQLALCGMLRDAPAPRRYAIVDILGIAGSSACIRPLQKYIQHERDAQLIGATASALDAVHARQAMEAQRAVLLRPAEAPYDPGYLLRPVTNQENTDQALLLRPDEGPQ